MRVDGRRASYTVGGSGLPVVFLHGWALGHNAYRGALSGLTSRGCKVYAPSLPGFGGTADLPAGQRTMAGYAAWVEQFVEALDLREPMLVVGHSFGGGVSIRFAHDCPERVRYLVVINSVGGQSWLPGPHGVRRLAERPMWEWGLQFGREMLRAVRRLVQTADVLISNFVPGTMESWGLGYEGLAELNPRLVYAAASAFGPIGPDAGREGADLVAQAASGFISTTGRDGNEPTPMGAAISDHSGSQNLVIGILAALLHRAGSGVGQRVDVSLLGASIWAQASEYSYYLTSGRMPSRANRGHPLVRGVLRMFPTADGWIVLVGVPPHLWPGFARALERPELAADPRFNTLVISRNHLGELFDILDGIFRSRTTADWSERLGAEQQRFAAVRTYEDVVKDPQVWLNGYFVEGEHPERGRVKVVGNPIRLSATPTEPGIVAPEIGQHTEEVLLEVGFSWDEIDELRAEGAW